MAWITYIQCATSTSPKALLRGKGSFHIRPPRRGENSMPHCVIFVPRPEMRGGNLYLPSGRSCSLRYGARSRTEKNINYKLWITRRVDSSCCHRWIYIFHQQQSERRTDLPSSNSCGASLINWWTCAGRHAQIKSPYANFEWGLRQWRKVGSRTLLYTRLFSLSHRIERRYEILGLKSGRKSDL